MAEKNDKTTPASAPPKADESSCLSNTMRADLKELQAQVLGQGGQQERMACLIVVGGSGIGAVHRLSRDEFTIGRVDTADIVIRDDRVSRMHATITRTEEGNYVLADLGTTNGTFCNGQRITSKVLEDNDHIFIGGTSLLKFSIQAAADVAFQEHLFESAAQDPLTKCYNRRYLQEQMLGELRYAARNEQPLSLLVMDVDEFKQLNDVHGHPFGDRVLVELVACIRRLVREGHLLCRYGGDEFILILRGTNTSGAHCAAERVRATVERQAFLAGETAVPVRISIGVASYDPSKDVRPPSPAELLMEADKCLYEAKCRGRNRVV